MTESRMFIDKLLRRNFPGSQNRACFLHEKFFKAKMRFWLMTGKITQSL